uniref:Arrestin-C n=1 Tax=Eptatretus burgeri TaxID=7764 RepID=A0A8C4ND77_EPTBU
MCDGLRFPVSPERNLRQPLPRGSPATLGPRQYLFKRRTTIKLYVSITGVFRYGRQDMDVIGMPFRRDIYIAHVQLYPQMSDHPLQLTHLQQLLLNKLGPNAFPFTFTVCKACFCFMRHLQLYVIMFHTVHCLSISSSLPTFTPSVEQIANVVLYSHDKYVKTVLSEIFPDTVEPNSTLSRTFNVTPLLANNRSHRGIVLDGRIKHEDTNLASSTMSVFIFSLHLIGNARAPNTFMILISTPSTLLNIVTGHIKFSSGHIFVPQT